MLPLRVRWLPLAALVLLPGVAAADKVHDFTPHSGSVRGVAFSNDGKTLVTAAYDGNLRVWTVADAKLQRTVAIYNAVSHAVYTPDGKSVITSVTDGTVRVYNPDTGTQLRYLPGRGNQIHQSAVSPDGKLVASVGYDRNVRVWDPEKASEKTSWLGDDSYAIWGVAFSPDGKMLVTGGQDRTVRIWNPETGKEIRKFSGHGDIVTGVAFLPDGRTAVSCSQDRTVKLWEIATGKERLTFSGHTSYVRVLALSSDGRTAASAGYDNVVRLWDTVTGKELKKLEGHTRPIWSLAFSPDNKYLASGGDDNLARLWKVGDITGRAAPKETKIDAKELEAHWKALESDDGPKAYKAVGALIQAPESAMGMFKDNLKPVKEAEDGSEKKVTKFLGDLEDPDYAVRKKAIDTLSTMGATIAPQVRKSLGKATDVDLKLRLYVVLRALEGGDETSPAVLRAMRALEVLERIGTKEAMEHVQGLTKGVADAHLTKESKVVLARMSKRAAVKDVKDKK